MEDSHKKLIDKIQDERPATPLDLCNMHDILGQALGGDLKHFPIKEKIDTENTSIKRKHPDTKKYLIPLQQRTIREYNPDLETSRDSMEEAYDEGDDLGATKQINTMLEHYKKSLTLDDILDIYLLLVDIKLRNCTKNDKETIDETLSILEYMRPYEQKLDSEQKISFWNYLGNTCFLKAGIDNDYSYYERANNAFDKVLHMHSTGKAIDDILDIGSYKEVVYFKACGLYFLGEYTKSLSIINDFLDACGWDPRKNIYKNPDDEQELSHIFAIQGDIYKHLYNYENAIRSYENCLLFEPDNEKIKKIIRFLSRELPE